MKNIANIAKNIVLFPILLALHFLRQAYLHATHKPRVIAKPNDYDWALHAHVETVRKYGIAQMDAGEFGEDWEATCRALEVARFYAGLK